MNAATVALIVQAVATLAPYLAQLGRLAAKAQAGKPITAADLTLAEEARRAAFANLREELVEKAETAVNTIR